MIAGFSVSLSLSLSLSQSGLHDGRQERQQASSAAASTASSSASRFTVRPTAASSKAVSRPSPSSPVAGVSVAGRRRRRRRRRRQQHAHTHTRTASTSNVNETGQRVNGRASRLRCGRWACAAATVALGARPARLCVAGAGPGRPAATRRSAGPPSPFAARSLVDGSE